MQDVGCEGTGGLDVANLQVRDSRPIASLDTAVKAPLTPNAAKPQPKRVSKTNVLRPE